VTVDAGAWHLRLHTTRSKTVKRAEVTASFQIYLVLQFRQAAVDLVDRLFPERRPVWHGGETLGFRFLLDEGAIKQCPNYGHSWLGQASNASRAAEGNVSFELA